MGGTNALLRGVNYAYNNLTPRDQQNPYIYERPVHYRGN